MDLSLALSHGLTLSFKLGRDTPAGGAGETIPLVKGERRGTHAVLFRLPFGCLSTSPAVVAYPIAMSKDVARSSSSRDPASVRDGRGEEKRAKELSLDPVIVRGGRQSRLVS